MVVDEKRDTLRVGVNACQSGSESDYVHIAGATLSEPVLTIMMHLFHRIQPRRMISLAAGIPRSLFHLRVQTQAFNAHHDTFSLRLASRNYLRTRKVLLMFYDTGSVLVIFGMFTAVVLLVWTMLSLLSSTFLRVTAPDTSTSLLKRAVGVATRATAYPRVTHAVNPIVSKMQQ